MNWITAAVLACFVTSATLTTVANASGLRYSSMPLESLPIVQSDSWSANVVSPAQSGHYRGLTLTCGILLTSDEHLRSIDHERLTLFLHPHELIPPVIATPRETVHKFFR